MQVPKHYRLLALPLVALQNFKVSPTLEDTTHFRHELGGFYLDMN